MTTGQRIKEARKNAGMTQMELAQKLNVPFQSVSQWERDVRKPKMETLSRIADALGIQLWELSEDISNFIKVSTALAEREALIKFVTESDGIPYQFKEIISKNFPSSIDAGMTLFRIIQELRTLKEPNDIAVELLSLFSQLNTDGQQKAVERVEELTEIPRYRAETPISKSNTTLDNPSSED